jgi:hypothetical protein
VAALVVLLEVEKLRRTAALAAAYRGQTVILDRYFTVHFADPCF